MLNDPTVWFLLFGMLLLFVGLSGGGFKAKEVSMPTVGPVARTLSGLLGAVIILGCVLAVLANTGVINIKEILNPSTSQATPQATANSIEEKLNQLEEDGSKPLGTPGPTKCSVPNPVNSTPVTTGNSCYQIFQYGSLRSEIFWTQGSEAHEIRGQIYKKWKKWEGDPDNIHNELGLGNPISNERPVECNDKVTGVFNNFERGSIYLKSENSEDEDPAFNSSNHAYVVYKPILDKWKEANHLAPCSKSGGKTEYPKNDTVRVPLGDGNEGDYYLYNDFEGGDSGNAYDYSIYWRKDNSDAYKVEGEIRKAWGGPTNSNTEPGKVHGPLGLPISDEETDPDGGKRTDFEKGSIHYYYSGKPGARPTFVVTTPTPTPHE